MDFLLWIHNPLFYHESAALSVLYSLGLTGRCFELYNSQSIVAKSLLLSLLHSNYYASMAYDDDYDWTLIYKTINQYVKHICSVIGCHILEYSDDVIMNAILYLKDVYRHNPHIHVTKCNKITKEYLSHVKLDSNECIESCATCENAINPIHYCQIDCNHYQCTECAADTTKKECNKCHKIIKYKRHTYIYKEEYVPDGPIKTIVLNELSNLKIKSDDDKLCICCLVSSCDVIYIPCGHQVICFKCLGKTQNHKCIICRNTYEHVIHSEL